MGKSYEQAMIRPASLGAVKGKRAVVMSRENGPWLLMAHLTDASLMSDAAVFWGGTIRLIPRH